LTSRYAPFAWLQWNSVAGIFAPINYLLHREVNRYEVYQMLKQFKSFARALRIPSSEDRETAYLNGAIDRIDLEYRQRQIDRGLFRKNY
jgi:hypothetical protein